MTRGLIRRGAARTAALKALGATEFVRVHLHLNHASDITTNERCDHMRRQGAGNVRGEARRHVIADGIHRKPGWKGESGFSVGFPPSDMNVA